MGFALKFIRAWGGLILGLASLWVFLFSPEKADLSAYLAAAAFILLVLTFRENYRMVLRMSGKRSARLGINSIVMVVLFFFIVVLLNLIAGRYYFRIDLSANRDFSISPLSAKVLEDVDEGLKLTLFVKGKGAQYRDALSLMDSYRYIEPRLVYHVYDLDEQPAIAASYGVESYGTSVVEFGGRVIVAEGTDEESLTNGIIRASQNEIRTVYFVEGHGERQSGNEGPRGYSRAASSLRARGFLVDSLNLSSVDFIPQEASVVVVAGPKTGYTDEEARKVHDYAQRGRLLFMSDPEGSDMFELLAVFGLKAHNGMVLDKKRHMAGRGESVPVVSSYPDGDLTRDFGLTTVYPTVRAVSGGTSGKVYEYYPFIRTSSNSTIEALSQQEALASDEQRTRTIGILVIDRKSNGRVILVGDSDFASNDNLDISGNGNLFRNMVGYLSGEASFVRIEPRRADYVPLYITENQAKSAIYVFTVGLPLMVSLAGFIAWYRRRGL